MRPAIVAFALGVAWLQRQAELPETGVAVLLAALGALLVALPLATRRLRYFAILGAALLGFSWAAYRADQRLADVLPEANEGRDVEVVGVVVGLPQRF
ncbi:MAG TPA: DUF4131 domain-containing protein, partial [Rhodocyclaceae bacterium]